MATRAQQHMAHVSGSKAMKVIGTSAALLLCGASVSLTAGCRGDRSEVPPRQFFPDMEDSPRFNPQTQTQFFEDGRTMRPQVAGTVAFARWAYNDAEVISEPFNAARRDLLREDSAFYQGRNADGSFVARIPIPVDADLILRGQERFNIFCAVCHGYTGDGQGMVGARWTAPVPSFHDPALQDLASEGGRGTDGYIFHTAMNGVIRPDGTPSMPPYSHALSARDAWAVAAYIRVLQETHHGTLDDVPPDRRRELEAERARRPAAQPGAGQNGGQNP